MASNTSVCIVSQNAFGSLTGKAGHIGGVELQTAMLARYLASRDHTVSFVTWDEGYPEIELVAGIRLVRLCRRDAGIPVVRFFYPRWTSLNKALRLAGADVYYHNGAEYTTGQIAMFCRKHGKAFVFSAASDSDTDPGLPALESMRERVLYRYGLRHATSIVVQTRTQQRALAAHFGRESSILPMPCDISPEYRAAFDANTNPQLLWVGRVVTTKRLELYLDVAQQHPQMTFHIAGGPDDDVAYAESMFARAGEIGNVTWHGSLSRDKLMKLFRQVQVLVCTSELEGFPNTFLEAWGLGIPVVSTFDPDDLIAEKHLGRFVVDTADIGNAIEELVHSEQIWREASDECKRYFDEHHSLRVAMRRFEKMLTSSAQA